jgi:molecular chaperone HscB
MDAEDVTAKQTIIQQIAQLKNELYAPIQNYMEMDQIDSISQEAMLQIKSYYYKKKYLDRILEDFHH